MNMDWASGERYKANNEVMLRRWLDDIVSSDDRCRISFKFKASNANHCCEKMIGSATLSSQTLYMLNRMVLNLHPEGYGQRYLGIMDERARTLGIAGMPSYAEQEGRELLQHLFTLLNLRAYKDQMMVSCSPTGLILTR
jgi:hypothetical protein